MSDNLNGFYGKIRDFRMVDDSTRQGVKVVEITIQATIENMKYFKLAKEHDIGRSEVLVLFEEK